jgi:polyphosphate kinase
LRDEILGSYLKDNVKARILQPDGTYVRPPNSGARFVAQEYLMGLATRESGEPAKHASSISSRPELP